MAGRGPFAVDDEMMYAHPDELMGRALGSDVALGSNIVAGEYGGIPTSTAVRMGIAPAGTNTGANTPTPSAAAAKPAAGGASPIDPAIQPAATVASNAAPAIPPVPTPPVRDNTRMTELEAQRDKLNKPTDPNSVKPSFWQQLIGYASAAAGGYASTLGRHPYQTDIGSRIHKSLWEEPLDRAEKARTGQLDETNKAINQENQKYHDAMDSFSATVTGYRAQTEARQAAATEQLHQDQLNEKKGEIIKQYTAEDPKDVDPKTKKGRIHQYEVDRSGKVFDRGVAPKDQNLEETHRHNVAQEGIERDRSNREKSSDHAVQLAGVEKWKQDEYTKLEGETKKGLEAAGQDPRTGQPLPMGDPVRQQREKAVYDEKQRQAKIIEDGYNNQRAQLGATNGAAAQSTPGGSKTSQVSGAPATPQASAERISVIRPDGIAGTIPKSQSGMIGKGKYKGWKLGGAK